MTIITAICRALGLSGARKTAAAFVAGDIDDPHADEPCIINGRDITYRQLNDELADVYARQREACAPRDLSDLKAAIIAQSR